MWIGANNSSFKIPRLEMEWMKTMTKAEREYGVEWLISQRKHHVIRKAETVLNAILRPTKEILMGMTKTKGKNRILVSYLYFKFLIWSFIF